MLFRTVLLALGAVFVLMGGVVLYAWYAQNRTTRVAGEGGVASSVENRASVSLLTAARAIPKGTLFRQEDFKTTVLGPKEQLQPGNLAPGEEKDFLGALSRSDYAEGERLIASKFIKPSDRSFLAAVLKPGLRAITIFVDAAQSVAGLALPGDNVDVILIQSFDDKTGADLRHRTAAETVLHGAQVIAIDQTLTPPAGIASAARSVNTEARIPKTVTLEVDERDAEKLLVAAKLGTFQLTLVPLEVVAADTPAGRVSDAPPVWAFGAKRKAKPVWASDVSVALDEVAKMQSKPPAATAAPAAAARSPCPPKTGSTLDKSVRCAPSPLTYYRAPAALQSQPAGAAQPGQSLNMRSAPAPGQEEEPQ